ncbi:MAG: hypothetical protein JW810_03520 [Sedimentisphaerales bacterium]|nr:hypothetical protein [Sedimentisphaerales bacterium]
MFRLSDYRRVIGLTELLFVAGRTLKRQGVKYTVIAACIGGGAMLAEVVGNRLGYQFSVNNVRAMLLPALVALLTFGLGNTLVAVSNLFRSERILMADANAMNLMEDRKKADTARHLETLWERVFSLEFPEESSPAAAGNDPAAKSQIPEADRRPAAEDHCGNGLKFVVPFCPLGELARATKADFVRRADFSLKHSLPQKLEQALTGCNLSLLEDWYDGAFFTLNDNKLKKQYAAHQTIRAVRRMVGLSAACRLRETLVGCPDPLWFTLTMRKIAMGTGSWIRRMNQRHVPATAPLYFNAQHFLWRHEATDRLILSDFPDRGEELLEILHAAHRELFRQVFSGRQATARRQIFGMFGGDYLHGLELRLQFDVEFAAGILPYDPREDIRQFRSLHLGTVYSLASCQQYQRRARQNLERIDAFCRERLADLWADRPRRRAARIAFHINRHRLQARLDRDPDGAAEILCRRVMAAHRRYSERLCLLRQHYELTRLQLLSYIQMVDELAGFAKDD